MLYLYTVGSMFQIFFTLAFFAFISIIIIRSLKISSIKMMIFGVGVMLFSESILKKVRFDIDEISLLIGFGIVIGGLFTKDSLN